VVPEIPGSNKAINVLDAYKIESKIKRKVLMVGGGLSGCETALHLADNGHEVVIIEMLDKIVSEAGGMILAATKDQIGKRENISIRTEAKCVEIYSKGIKVETGSGETEFIEGEIAVISMGMREKVTETESLRAAAGESIVFEIGDCVRSAKVYEAVSQGFMAAMKII
jgi:pyruvate/2-oxoglutarate dehydrogenase complex dihydrolipoamide dehydrogenase (E3) component